MTFLIRARFSGSFPQSVEFNGTILKNVKFLIPSEFIDRNFMCGDELACAVSSYFNNIRMSSVGEICYIFTHSVAFRGDAGVYSVRTIALRGDARV